MKKRIVSLVLVCMLILALGLSAGAENSRKEGIANIAVADAFSNTVSVVPMKADGTVVASEGGVYPDAVKLSVSYNAATAGGYYLVLALTTDNGTPTENNIQYIDQNTAGAGQVSFTVYPRELEAGGTYYIYLSSNVDEEVGALTQVASFAYVSYRVGDVDGNGYISSNDAVWVMNAAAENITLNAAEALAADVNHDGSVDVTDALFILQAVVHLRTLA